MTNDFDDAAIERVARWLCVLDGKLPDDVLKLSDQGDYRYPAWIYYKEQAREAVNLLTQPPDAV